MNSCFGSITIAIIRTNSTFGINTHLTEAMANRLRSKHFTLFFVVFTHAEQIHNRKKETKQKKRIQI